MPSIAEVTRGRRGRSRRRLVGGVGLVLVGAFLVGVGAAGTVSDSAARTGLIVGGLAVLVSLWALVVRIPLRQRERSMAYAGTTAATVSVLSLWVFAPTSVLPTPDLAVGVGLGYAIGVTVLMAAVLAGLTLPERRAPRDPGSNPVAWTRTSSGSSEARQVADGGAADDDLSFPLEEE